MKLWNILKSAILLVIGFLIIVVLVTNTIIGTKADTVKEITAAEVKKVKIGMNLDQVISILGRPIMIEGTHGLHNIGCVNPRPMLKKNIYPETDIKLVIDNYFKDRNYCCEGNKEDFKLHNETALTYNQPVKFAKSYPMLWVHLDSTQMVNSVYVKIYAGTFGFDSWDAFAIYSLSSNNEKTQSGIKNDLNGGSNRDKKLFETFK